MLCTLLNLYPGRVLAGDNGADASPVKAIKSLRRLDDTIHRFGGHGDNWHMSWASNDKVYVSMCDGTGMPGVMPGEANAPKIATDYNSRLFAISGDAPKLKFEFLPDYPQLLNQQPRMSFRYYNFGTLAIDGKIYQFLSAPNVPFNEPNPRFVGAKLIYSPDDGKTWQNQNGSSPVTWEKWEDRSKQNMAFFEEPGDAFSLISVLQMGQNYSLNKDGYVYLYSPNGNTEGTMNEIVLCRVPKEKLLDRNSYEFFAGASNDVNSATWSKRIDDRKPVHTFPAGYVNKFVHPYAWQPSVVYFAPSREYVMTSWGMGVSNDGKWFAKPSYLGFWTARQLWGPWKLVHEELEWAPAGEKTARCYQPQIAPKWISNDGSRFWLVWTDYQEPGHYYSFNAQEVAVEFGD
jgi:hypothetical protein